MESQKVRFYELLELKVNKLNIGNENYCISNERYKDILDALQDPVCAQEKKNTKNRHKTDI